MAMIARRLRQFRKLGKLLANADYRKALRRAGVAAAIEHERLLKSLGFDTVVDIGANRGQFALVSRHCFPQAQIIAFEPLAEPARRFRIVHGSDPRVALHQIAIGPVPASATMNVTAEDDCSSLLPITTLQRSLFAATKVVGTETIQVQPLTSVVTADNLGTPALLKIDVQGYELPVLQGCETLLSCFSHVYVECSFVELYEGQVMACEIIDYLHGHGFNLAGVHNVQYDPQGRTVQADMLFSLSSSGRKHEISPMVGAVDVGS